MQHDSLHLVLALAVPDDYLTLKFAMTIAECIGELFASLLELYGKTDFFCQSIALFTFETIIWNRFELEYFLQLKNLPYRTTTVLCFHGIVKTLCLSRGQNK